MQSDHPIAQPRIDPAITLFSETATFRRYGTVIDPDVDAPEDLYLRSIIHEQGFDGFPHVVSRRVLDRYVAIGEHELFRGLTTAAYADAFRFGDFFVGRGIYSGGVSAVSGLHALAVAREYAAGGVVMRLTLKAGARIADFDELDLLAQHRLSEAMALIRETDEQERAAARVGGEDVAVEAMQARQHALQETIHAQYDDIGRLAAYLGYDAVHAADLDFYAILNRTAVRVQHEDLR